MQRPAFYLLFPCPPLGVYLFEKAVTTWGNPVKTQALGPTNVHRDARLAVIAVTPSLP